MKKLDLNLGAAWRNWRLSAFEWVALAATLIFVGVVTFNYLNSTHPLRTKLDDLKARKKNLQSKILDDASKGKALAEQRDNAEKILDSLDSFEGRLHNRRVGVTAIIDEVNQLAKANRVSAGDISFRTDAPEQLAGEAKPGAGTSPTPAPITRRDKLPNVYEGLGLDTTVEGDYHDLRRFMAALERSRNFVIINAITLQSIDEQQRSKFKLNNSPPGASSAVMNPAMNPNPGGPPGAPLPLEGPGAGQPPMKVIVALKVELETHFAREAKPEAAPKPLPANAPAAR